MIQFSVAALITIFHFIKTINPAVLIDPKNTIDRDDFSLIELLTMKLNALKNLIGADTRVNIRQGTGRD